MLDWILVLAALGFAVYIIVKRAKKGGAAGISGGCENCAEKGGCAAFGDPDSEECGEKK